MHESRVLETYYSGNHGDVFPTSLFFTHQVVKRKKAIGYTPSEQHSQLPSASLMTEHMKLEVKNKSCVAVLATYLYCCTSSN